MDIVQLIYRPFEPQGASKDYEFSRGTMNARWEQGMSDASTTLRAAPWLAPKPREVGVRVFDVMHDVLVGKSQATKAKPTDGDRTNTRPTKGRSS
jgi:NTE family protein